MSRQKLRVVQTDVDNLVTNLRGEVGEIITTWVLLRWLRHRERELSSGDIGKDMKDQNLAFHLMLGRKLSDEIVARLSELAEEKIGQLNFYFASLKINGINSDVTAYAKLIAKHKLNEKRNYDISHKVLPEKWSGHRSIQIQYRTILRAIAKALIIMKKIDREIHGPASTFLWGEMRKRRYSLMNPASAAYFLLPYLKLSKDVRAKIIMREMELGCPVWEQVPTEVNGQRVEVPACKRWGAVLLPDRLIVLDEYPLQDLNGITFDAAAQPDTDSIEPIVEQKVVHAKYKVEKVEANVVRFVPVIKEHLVDGTSIVTLPPIGIQLGDGAPPDLSAVRIGDTRDFAVGVSVVTGYRKRTS